ncbi:trypsin-like serine protease [Streptomyces sp. A1136]|nr:trypsin-like serine protease [Streptomyces sp. A1136]
MVTAVLCGVAALGASAAMTTVVPAADGTVSAHPKSAPSGTASAKPPSRSQSAKQPQLAKPPRPSSTPVTPRPGGPSAFTGALFEGGLDGDHFCTATVVHSPGRNLIVTAGHCLVAGKDGVGGAVFAPAYANGKAPYGTWKLEEVYEDTRWTDDGNDDYDLAFARLAPDASGRDIEDLTGAAVLDTSGRTGEEVTVTGYPADRKVPRTCTAVSVREKATEQRFDCADFPGGTSGSAWIARDGKIVGILTGGDTDDVSTSTVLGEYAASLYARATAG